MRGKWCALFNHYILFFQDFLPPTTPITESKAIIGTRKIKLSNGVRSLGNGGVAAKFCLEKPIWPPLPKEGVTQW